MVFAGHLDSFIVINNHFNRLKTTAISGSGQINVQLTLIRIAVTGKNRAPESLRSRDTAYLACTGIRQWADRRPGPNGIRQLADRLLRRVTPTNLIAVPLGGIAPAAAAGFTFTNLS
jgi:hypothetical protein